MERCDLLVWNGIGCRGEPPSCVLKNVVKVVSSNDIDFEKLEEYQLEHAEGDDPLIDEYGQLLLARQTKLYKATVILNPSTTSDEKTDTPSSQPEQAVIKVVHIFHDDEQDKVDYQYRQLKAEFEAYSKCQGHSSILKLYGMCLIHRSSAMAVFYMMFEYPTRGTLADRLARFTDEDKWTVASELVSAVQHMHSKGYVHQSISPHSIMVFANGNCKLAEFGNCFAITEPDDDCEWTDDLDKDYAEKDILSLCDVFACMVMNDASFDLTKVTKDHVIKKLTRVHQLGEIAFLCSRFKRPTLFQLKYMIQKRVFVEFNLSSDYRDLIDKYANEYCENVMLLKKLVEAGDIVDAFRESLAMVRATGDLFLPYICREPNRYSEYIPFSPEEQEAQGVDFTTVPKKFVWSYRLALFIMQREFMIALGDQELSRRLMGTKVDSNANNYNPLREVDEDFLKQIEKKQVITKEKREIFKMRETISLQHHLESGMVPKWKNGEFDERTVRVWEDLEMKKNT
eukprot:TRINITY_DN9265_c0_g1_i1.p1 TRINITY_DN9265_c0_g1~~TRINITY_DN9265_c0_g1_i1.p1  ORF type:complete len:512 (-),score=129.60 TRINITY_DN9265_c0_g1_i1:2371-3906(-)